MTTRGALGNFAFRMACVAGTLAGFGFCVPGFAGIELLLEHFMTNFGLQVVLLETLKFFVGFVAGTRPGSCSNDLNWCETASGALLAAAGAI